MSLARLIHGIVVLSLPWCALEVGSYVWRKEGRRLPLVRAARGRSHSYDDDHGRTTSFSRSALWIKWETSAFNALPAQLLAWIQGSNHPVGPNGRSGAASGTHSHGRRARLMLRIYDAGSIFALLAQAFSVLFLVWGAFNLIDQIVNLSTSEEIQQDDGGMTLQRRQSPLVEGHWTQPIDTQSGHADAKSWSPNLVPLIPGLTLPWSHLVPLVLALSFTQIVHEFGHAFCGTLYDLAPLRMGVMLFYPAIPGAFVVLPSQASQVADGAMDDDDGERTEEAWHESDDEEYPAKWTSLRQKASIISAGVWHNALSAVLLSCLLMLPVGQAVHGLLWTDSTALRVYDVDKMSPLSAHIRTGALITALEDVRIDSKVEASKRASLWNSFLAYQVDEISSATSKGWCIATSEWQKTATSCCDKFASEATTDPSDETQSSSDSLCFITIDTSQGRCHDATELVQSNASRCQAHCPSSINMNGEEEAQLCIVPDAREKLVRIATKDDAKDAQGNSSTSERIVLFQGDREAIQMSLGVSAYDFRFASLHWPESVFNLLALVVQYSLTLSIAMAVFNMLPLPTLDGDVFLQIVFAYIAHRLRARNNRDSVDERGLDELEMRSGVHDGPRRPLGIGQELNRRNDVTASGGTVDGDCIDGEGNEAEGTANFGASRHLRPLTKGLSASLMDSDYLQSRSTTRQQSKMPYGRTLAQIHTRIRWATMALAIFVMGGSVMVHIVQN